MDSLEKVLKDLLKYADEGLSIDETMADRIRGFLKTLQTECSKITCKSCGVNEPRLPDGWLELDIRPYDVEKPSFEKNLYMCPGCAVKLLGTKGDK